LDVLGGLDGVGAGLLVVGAGVVVAGALLLAPAATAPPPVVDPASDEPPEHAASANAPATATAPTKILFTIRHPHEVFQVDPVYPGKTGYTHRRLRSEGHDQVDDPPSG
jgi:hypothetical protein